MISNHSINFFPDQLNYYLKLKARKTDGKHKILMSCHFHFSGILNGKLMEIYIGVCHSIWLKTRKIILKLIIIAFFSLFMLVFFNQNLQECISV